MCQTGSQLQLRQNRRDTHDQSEIFGPKRAQGYSEQAGGGPGWKRMCQRVESCNSQADAIVLAASVVREDRMWRKARSVVIYDAYILISDTCFCLSKDNLESR